MSGRAERAVAIVGVGAILPDAPNAPAFWQNICTKRYSIIDVPEGRWRVEDYYDPDPAAKDKTYSRIGGWVRGFAFDWKRFHVPPRVASAMDEGQQWAVTIAAEALADFGWPDRALDLERTGVVLGAAMGGELHYVTAQRVMFPEFRRALDGVPEFGQLPADVRRTILAHWHERIDRAMPPITEDTMPGELPNIISGRVANVLNLRGPNFITDAACASSLAALDAAVDLLAEGHCDAVVTGGVDRNMGASTFVKFSKIGALSATGTRPFGDGADGFVMGEGAAVFLVKRLADAERDGDRIYAVVRGVGESSDGKGKGITAPNPAGQRLAIERAWADAGLDPATAGLVEAHGTSTKVGDVVEVESLAAVYGGAKRGSIALGSVKSNLGHLKAGAGAAGLLKAVFALHTKQLPPTLNAERPNPNVDFGNSPFALNHELRPWERNGTPRRAGVSAYGFGGTNFHVVLEEHVPGAIAREGKTTVSVPASFGSGPVQAAEAGASKPPQRGLVLLGAPTVEALRGRADALLARVRDGAVPPVAAPAIDDRGAPERLAIDFDDGADLVDKLLKSKKALDGDATPAWRALAAQGIFRGRGTPTGKIAFLFPGQGSQYVNMGRVLAEREPAVKRVFDEADAVLTSLVGRPLTSYLFADPNDPAAMTEAEEQLKQTAITQPAVLTVDAALAALLAEYGFRPDIVMGHSLGEYAALVAAGVLPFADALEAAAARGREMTRVSLLDNGWMAAVMAPLDVIEKTLTELDGYVVAANINSRQQAVIGGESEAVRRAMERFAELGFQAVRLPVSHAFHTRIVAPASGPLGHVLDRLRFGEPRLPVVGNVHGRLYPRTVPEIKDLLVQQIASPVQWVRGLETLWAEGARTFVEVGPKKALRGFTDELLGSHPELVSLHTNHPKPGELATFNHALAALYAAGHAGDRMPRPHEITSHGDTLPRPHEITWHDSGGSMHDVPTTAGFDALTQLLARALSATQGSAPVTAYDRNRPPDGSIVITGCGLGLPGAEKRVMDETNAERILRGEQFIDLVPARFRERMADKRVTRVVKDGDGNGRFETIEDTADVLKLAGRPGAFDLAAEYGVSPKLIEALDFSTQLAMAAGLDALREAGIPLVQTFRKTSKGTYLPDRMLLPEALRDETGVIFASAFPGLDRFADESRRYYEYRSRVARRTQLEELAAVATDDATLREIRRRITAIDDELRREPYAFDRRFLLRVLSMGHSQFAEYVGARGPNMQCNAACASTANAIATAEDWIRTGRCRRVVVVAADDATSDNLLEWVGAGFLASGAAATDDKVEEAALPFDRRRHGTIMGMGAAALVLESQDAVEERGMRGIVELLATEVRNSAFHATRLDVDHVTATVESLVSSAERRYGIDRRAIAAETVFVSHETFTPARGGSASAEVAALRHVFGRAAEEIVVSNTKGFTGHPMGVGVEDVIAVKILEHGIVPPVPNYRDVDEELGHLNLSRGGRYPVQYAIHLAAGFGSQIALTLTRRVPGSLDRIDDRARHQRWLEDVSGQGRAELEVVQRVLRIVPNGAPERAPAPSTWTFGIGPSRRAPEPGRSGARPMPQAIVVPERERAVPRVAAPERDSVKADPAPVAAPEREPAMPAPEREPVAASPTPPAAPVADEVQQSVLAIVAEKTGYPEDMLDLELDLEADLGVDTVKQAETFAAVRERFGIPRVENLKLRDFPTLKHVIEFVYAQRPELRAVPAPVHVEASVPQGTSDVQRAVLAIVAEKTGYPEDMLDLELDLEADLGVDTVKQAETFAAVRERFGIPRVENLKLRDFPTLKHVIEFVYGQRPELRAAPAPVHVETPAPQGEATASEVQRAVLAIVAEKTGYPEDMLDLELDLEADLGVDTVKQAETFAAVRERFDIPRVENLKLRDFPTLKHVIEFVHAQRPELRAAPAPVHVEASVPQGTGDVQRAVLAIVAEKTGYPEDMLDLELDLEADLGVDTVKQAETFAAVRERFGIPRVENLKLRDFPTLKHVIEFVYAQRPELRAAPVTTPVPEPAPARKGADLDEADRFARRVAVPVLRPSLSFCKTTAVRLIQGSRVIVARDAGGVADRLANVLADWGIDVLELDPAAPADELEAAVIAFANRGPVAGVYWLPALDLPLPLPQLDLPAFRELNRARVKNFFRAVRALGGALGGPDTFVIGATRMGGLFGHGEEGALEPLGGSVAGFCKAVSRELPHALVKVVDVAGDAEASAVASAVIEETLGDPGVVEVGRRDGRRWSIGLEERPAADGRQGLRLSNDSVFVVTGAAGGITSAIVADLAAASGGTFWLLDLVEPPPAGDAHVACLRQSREALKEALIGEAKARGEKPRPAAIDREILAVERRAAALAAIEAVESAGGTAHYRSVNLLDGPAVAAVMEEIRAASGRIDVLVHAAGIEISRAIADKEPQEFERVFDIKADGFFSLLHAAEEMALGATVVFSSVAGRFGNAGQTDYSAANALLCSMSRHLRVLRPETRAIAIDWTAWGGIGMATRGSIPRIMEAAGIDMLPPEIGIPTVRRELVRGGTADEVVVAGRLGIMVEERDENGGLDRERVAAWQRERALTLVGNVSGAFLHRGLVVETTLDPKEQPFLYDHQIDGTPVLPGVMGTEAFAEVAALLAPDLVVAEIRDARFLQPFKFHRMEPKVLHLSATGYHGADGLPRVELRLTSLLQPKPGVPVQERLHFRATVRLAAEAPHAEAAPPAFTAGASLVPRDAIYRLYFHGPSYRVLDGVRLENNHAIGQFHHELPANASAPGAATLVAPRLIELCFQTAGILEIAHDHAFGLPTSVGSVTVYRPEEPHDGVDLYAEVFHEGQGFDARVVDGEGRVWLELHDYRTVPLPGERSLDELLGVKGVVH